MLPGTFPPSPKHPISADSSLLLISTGKVLIQPQLSHQSRQLLLAQQPEQNVWQTMLPQLVLNHEARVRRTDGTTDEGPFLACFDDHFRTAKAN